MPAILGIRALNRATLSRQLLLERSGLDPVAAVRHLAGLQAQTPHTWYVGLFSRLRDCRPQDVADRLAGRELVRLVLMRSTIHLVTAADAWGFRPLVQPVLDRSLSGNFGRLLAGLDTAAVIAAGREIVDEEPRTWAEVGRLLAGRWPGRDPGALAQLVRAALPMVQVPPRGLWGRSGPVAHTSLHAWVGPPAPGTDGGFSVEEMIRRYLAAFGPAGVRDAQTWSGLTKLGEVVDRMRDELIVFRGGDGAELFDLPDAPCPDPGTPAPVRYLYDFDNLLLSHNDRSRVVSEAWRRQPFERTGPQPRAVLVDGFTRGTWALDTTGGTATLTVQPFEPLTAADVTALSEEGERLIAFAAAGATASEVRVVAPPA